MRRRRGWRLVAVVLVVGAIMAWPRVGGTPLALNLATGAAIWGLFALSYDLVLGWTGEVSFGHALYFGLGTYGAALLAIHTGWPTLVDIAVTVVAAGAIAVGLNLLALRVTGPYFAMITFALAAFTSLLVQSATSVTGGTNGLVGVPLDPTLTAPPVLYDVVVGVLLAATGGVLAVRGSRWGRVARAVRDNPVRAELLGFSVRTVKVACLVAAALLAALAGALYLLFQGMAFTDVFSTNQSFTVLLMVIIGGVDSAWGPVAAGAGLYLLENWLNGATAHWALALGIIYIVIVRFFPRGLSGVADLLRHARTPAGPRASLTPLGRSEADEVRG
jgi:branched-chain amino acid transport system permease protein